MRNLIKDTLAIGAILAIVLGLNGSGPVPINDNGEYFNYRALYAVAGDHYYPLNQGPIGTCVAVGHKGAVDGASAVEKITGKVREWLPVSAESIYGVARNESKGRACRSYSDGSSGYDATTGITKVGVTYQQPYPKFNLDLSKYDTGRAKEWGAWGNGGRADGIGGPFDKEASRHLVKETAKVTTLAEADAALKNGKFITICSNVGFSSPRDKEGFCSPRSNWSHCMHVIGKRQGGRTGYLVQNSWGPYIKGDDGDPQNPSYNQYKDQPDGSFYVEPAVLARILRAGDSYAISGQTGFEKLSLPSWLTSPDATAAMYAEPVEPQDDDREARVYQGTDGQWYFRDDDGKLLRHVNGEWLEVKANGGTYKCGPGGCRRVAEANPCNCNPCSCGKDCRCDWTYQTAA